MASQSRAHEDQPATPAPHVAKSLFEKEEIMIAARTKIARSYRFEFL
jgi:hypothetical protein